MLIFTPTSANKGTALRDAVLRALDAGLVTPDQLRVAVLAPRSCADKQRSSRLSTDAELRRLNPLLRYDGERPEDVKALGREFVRRYAEGAHAREGLNVWFAVDRSAVDGFAVDRSAVDGPRPARRVPLPAYPFERREHWIVPASGGRG